MEDQDFDSTQKYLPGHSTRLRQKRNMLRQRTSDMAVKRPNLTQDEISILKQAWAQDCPNGAVHKL